MQALHLAELRVRTMTQLTHLDEHGNAVMVDISGKAVTLREASAEGWIGVSEECMKVISSGSAQKGDVYGVARIAGIMGAKKTSELIPLCHILNLTKVSVDFSEEGERAGCGRKLPDGTEEAQYWIRVVCTVRTEGRTGVEMEALTGVSTALLTIYDMCKAVDRQMMITGICLLEKSGGKSGDFVRRAEPWNGSLSAADGKSVPTDE